MLGLPDLIARYRRSGADLPFTDPSRPRGIAMEGSFWRFTCPDGRVVIALRGRCLDAAGASWDLVAVVSEPGCVLAWDVGGHLDASPGRLSCAVGNARLEATFSEDVPWPRRAFGGLGPAQAIPGLGQYWHPHLLRGTARGSLVVGATTHSLDGAAVYAEGNWGSEFAGHWWWGQANDVGAADCVAFAGGRMLGGAPTSVVVAVGGEVLRFTPPLAQMAVATGAGRWRIRARGPRHTLELEAEADPAAAVTLPVPVPAERRAQLRSHQHLTGRLALRVRRGGRVLVDGETDRAGLERGVP